MVCVYLCGAVYKISWLSEMGSLQAVILPVFPNRYQLSCKERHHINRGFLCGQAEESPAYMGRDAEIHLIGMLPFCFFDQSGVYHCLCQIIGCQASPDFLHDKLWLVGMKIA